MSNIIKKEEIEQGAVGVELVKQQVEMVRSLMQSLMKEGVHYGKVPGSTKPTLLQPGADLLASHFGISVKCEVDYEERTSMGYRVRVKAEAYKGDKLLGSAFGEASSDEEKYKWRKAVCDEEYDDTPEDERRVKYKYINGKVSKIKQVRIPVADVSNTILKMAQKRAKVAVIRAITACSDIFEQDIEDIPAEIILNDKTEKEVAILQYNNIHTNTDEVAFDNSDSKRCITEKQAKRLFAIAKSRGVSKDALKEIVKRVAGVEHSNEIPIEKYDEIIKEVEGNVGVEEGKESEGGSGGGVG